MTKPALVLAPAPQKRRPRTAWVSVHPKLHARFKAACRYEVTRYAGVQRRGLDARGRAVLRLSGRPPFERLRGVTSAAHALSAETCDQCGSAGDPVRLAADPDAPPVTRCGRCRGPADELLPRPALAP